MKNMAGLCLFGFTLFCVGIFAGRQVKHSLQPLTLKSAENTAHLAELPVPDPTERTQNQVIAATGEPGQRQDTIRLASYQEPDEALRPNEPLLNTVPTPLEIKPDNIEVAAPTATVDTIQIIQNAWPGIDQATAEAWAIEMSGMSREDIEFLLEQRRAAGIRSFGSFLNGSELPKPAPAKSQGSVEMQSIPSIEGPACPTSLQQAIAQSLRNLSGMNAIGYRRSVVFLTPCQGNGSSGTVFPSWTYSSVRDFKCGDLMQTFGPLHVALPQDPQYMFVLSDSLLTRRGDFTLLASGRLGLSSGADSYPVEGVEAVPAEAEFVSIEVTGAVMAKLKDGTTKSLGRIQIAQVAQPGCMTTEDGVFFHCPAAQMEIVGERAVVSLQTGFVETANVVSDAEWKTLEHFRKLEQEWTKMMPAPANFSVY